MKTNIQAQNHGGSPRKRLAPLYIDRDKETYKVFSNEEIFRLVYGFKDFLKGCGMAERSASFYRPIATRFLHFLEKENRKPDDIKAAGDFMAQLNTKSLGYRSALKWFYVFLEKQGMTKIHPLGNLKVNLSYLRDPNPIIGEDTALTHNKNLSRQVHQNHRYAREIEFLQDEIMKLKKAIRYKNDRMQDILDAWEDSNLYHRPITAGEARKHFNLLHGAISYRGPIHIGNPSDHSNVRALDSEGRAKDGLTK